MAGDSEFEEAVRLIRKLTGKKHVKLVSRGNEAILWALEICAALGKDKVLIQDQGGWLTYLTYPKKFGMKIIEVKTVYGLVDPEDLEKKSDDSSVFLVNSMPGYLVYDDMKSLYNECNEKGVIIINDASGSIGTKAAMFGDLIIGSFGNWKPVEVGHGGFIATNEKWFSEERNHTFNKKEMKNLTKALKGLKRRIGYLEGLNRKVKKDLLDYDIIHRGGRGFNIAVKFRDKEEQERIINYCAENELDCTICPRYIRVNEQAVCIEVKREKEE